MRRVDQHLISLQDKRNSHALMPEGLFALENREGYLALLL